METKWTKEGLTKSFVDLQKRIGRRPTLEEFIKDKNTPSNRPIRGQFGGWTEFIKHMNLSPITRKKASISKPTYKNMGIYYGTNVETMAKWRERRPVIFNVLREAYIEIHKEKE